MSGILIICHANVCRSPLAAAAIARSSFLAALGVSSRGTTASPGTPMCEVADAVAAAEGIPVSPGRASQRLTRDDILNAELILTAERAQRGFVAKLSPESRSRTFTVLEALALARTVARSDPQLASSLPALAAALDSARGVAGADDRIDIVDGHGMSRRRHRAATRDIAEASTLFAALAEQLIGPESAAHSTTSHPSPTAGPRR